MGCFCNCIVGMVNFILMSFGLCLLISGALLHLGSKSECEKVLALPLLVIGSVLLLVSIIGVMGASCGSTFCMCIYLTLMFFLIAGLIAFTIFVIMITNWSVSEMFSHREGDDKPRSAWHLSNWLSNNVNNVEHWKKIKCCMIDTKVCLSKEYKVEAHFNVMAFVNDRIPDIKLYNKSLPDLQFACCKPPDNCGFIKVNDTYWEVPSSGPLTHTDNDDCTKWNNDLTKLCFDCTTCKAGVTNNIKREWKALTFVNACLLAFLIVVYMLGCCAFCF